MFDDAEKSQRAAREFLLGGPTFRFDGIEDSIKLLSTSTGRAPDSWEFAYEFQCRQAGYGDRSGQMLAQVITDHRAQILVEQGKVVHAVLDGRWDELRQEMIG